MKKILTVLAICTLMFSSLQINAHAENNKKVVSAVYNSNYVVFNGKEINLLRPLILVNYEDSEGDLTQFMPMCDLLEALGHKVTWNSVDSSIHISAEADNQMIRKVAKITDQIHASYTHNSAVYIGEKELKLTNPLLSVVNKGDVGIYTTYMPMREVLEGLGYTLEWDGNLNTVFIAYSKAEISISARDNKIEYNGLKPYRDGAFIYVPLEQTVKSLGHEISYNYQNGKISEAVLSIRANQIVLPINSTEIRIEPPKVGSSYAVSGANVTTSLTVTSNQVVDLMGREQKTSVPYVFDCYRNTITDNNGNVYVELNLLDEIFEIETNDSNSNVNIIDYFVRNFEIGELKCQP